MSTCRPRPLPGSSAPALQSAGSGRAGFTGALRSEFTKIRSVRSTYWTLIALVVVTIGIGTLACVGAVSRGADHGPGFDATQRSLGGLYLSQLVIVVLGALTITSEYSTGMIRTSLTAQPRRGTLFAAKAIVFGAVSLATGLVVALFPFAAIGGGLLAVATGGGAVLGAVAGHAAAGMSRKDLKELGEHLDAGQAGLVVVAVLDRGAEIERAMKQARKIEARQLKADTAGIEADAKSAQV